jgi:hypothetical protein
MRTLAFTVVGVLVVLEGCQQTRPPTWATDELDICEAVFRSQIQTNDPAVQQYLQQKIKAYFISIPTGDPTSEFLSKFKNHTPPVKPGSEFKMGEGLEIRVDEI